MESREVLLNLIILIVIISAIILTNGCSGSVQVDGGDGFTHTPIKWGVFGEPGACAIDCEYERPLFTTQTNYIAKLALASFGSHNGEFNIDLCSNGIIYYFSNINLDGQQTKAFLPFPGNNRDDMINHDVPYGWLESTGLIEESRTVDIREFFWRAGSLDATTGYLEDQGEIPAYNGLKYNFMEVNYAGELEDDLNGDLVELTYGFKSEFPCTGYKSVELSCDSGPDEAMIKCWNNDGTERVSVSGSERCGTFLNDVGDCGGDMLESNISNILEDVCVGMMELGLRDIRTQYGFEQYMTEEDCEIILPE